MGCYKLDILQREYPPLKVVYRRVDTEPKVYHVAISIGVVQMWYQVYPIANYSRNYSIIICIGVDPKAEEFNNMSPYCAMGNSPFGVTDPDGDAIHWAVQGLIGAASGIISNGLSNIVTNRSFFDGAAKAAAWGVVSAYASYGVGEIFKYAPSTVGKEIVQGFTHAFVHGNIAQLQGGSFLSGATSGLLSSGISSGITGLGGGDIEQILGGGLGGGIGSAINGENFWQGFMIGISVGAFNHAAQHFKAFLKAI